MRNGGHRNNFFEIFRFWKISWTSQGRPTRRRLLRLTVRLLRRMLILATTTILEHEDQPAKPKNKATVHNPSAALLLYRSQPSIISHFQDQLSIFDGARGRGMSAHIAI